MGRSEDDNEIIIKGELHSSAVSLTVSAEVVDETRLVRVQDSRLQTVRAESVERDFPGAAGFFSRPLD